MKAIGLRPKRQEERENKEGKKNRKGIGPRGVLLLHHTFFIDGKNKDLTYNLKSETMQKTLCMRVPGHHQGRLEDC